MINHIGFIMDGNRRWAHARSLPAFMGHKEGAHVVQKIVQACSQRGITHVTMYAFSLENFKRSEQEKQYLFELVGTQLTNKQEEFIKNGVRVHFVGDRRLFPPQIQNAIELVEQKTLHCNTITVHFLFCYGGQQEITAAARTCAQQIVDGTIKIDQITPDYFAQQLWLNDCPPPDLVIRTGGDMRLSNFLPYQCAYSELLFTNTYWPDFNEQELEHILNQFQQRKRNFGA